MMKDDGSTNERAAPSAQRDCPPAVIEVRRDDEGFLDEIVATGCDIHLEQMAGNSWWLGIYKDGYRQVVQLYTPRDAITAKSEMDDWPHTPAPKANLPPPHDQG